MTEDQLMQIAWRDLERLQQEITHLHHRVRFLQLRYQNKEFKQAEEDLLKATTVFLGKKLLLDMCREHISHRGAV